MKIDRLLSILILLLKKEKVTAPELAAYFETSLRTIYRDMEALSLAGIPLCSEQGSGGGYSLMPGFTLDRQVLKVDEMLALMAGLKGLQGLDEDKHIRQTYEKVQALAPQERDTLEIDFFGWDEGNHLQTMVRMLRKAISQNQLVGFHYTNLQGISVYRETEPHKLFFRGSHWYLLAWCRLRSDFRFFRISRMEKLSLLPKTFTPRETDSSKDNWPLSGPGNPHPPSNIHLRIKKEGWLKARDFFSEDNIILQQEDYMEVKVPFPVDEWLYSYLLGYGSSLRVLDPPELRQELLRRAGDFIANHQT